MTALHYAVRYASVELTELLLQKGAVPFFAASAPPTRKEEPAPRRNG